jgi:hypothetical protein
MKKMKKGTLILLIVIAVLVVAVAVFAILNAGSLEEKYKLEENAEFKITTGDTQITVTMDDILSLDPVEFEATMDTSTTDPTPVMFTDVELKKILDYFNIDYSAAETYEVTALDGYASALTQEEVMTDENVYIVIKKEGEALGTKSEGGSGPYMMIIRSATYSQRWCKFVEEITIT